jgi:exodeoxyribonuclease VII small subunit
MSQNDSALNFETSLKELEKIVAELEKGEQPLEDQLKFFEKGVALSRECMKRLEEVEKRVELLVQQGDGKIASSSFDAANETPL